MDFVLRVLPWGLIAAYMFEIDGSGIILVSFEEKPSLYYGMIIAACVCYWLGIVATLFFHGFMYYKYRNFLGFFFF